MTIKRFRVKKDVMDILTKVQEFLGERGIEGYLTGGFVRDALMQRQSAELDVDIAVGAPAMHIARELAEALHGRFVPLDEENGIARVVLAGQRPLHLDLATMRGGIRDDLELRDFTIDAVAINVKDIASADPPVIDPFCGQRDIASGVVRSISEDAFREDPLRLLRAVRLAAECDLSLDGVTRDQIASHHPLIAQVAAERVRDELCRLLAVTGAAGWLHLLDELGLLLAIIPELSPAKGEQQPKEHFWHVLDHSIETVAAVEFLLHMGGSEHFGDEILEVAPWSPLLERHFDEEIASGHRRGVLLKLAGLLHDIAKPQTKTIEETGRMRFFGHPQQGADMARGVMRRLRFSAREGEMMSKVVEHHLRPGQLARDGELPTQRAIYRYFRDTGDVGVDTIFLNLADHLAARGPMLEYAKWREHAEIMTYVLEKRFQDESVVLPPKLISGHDIIDMFGLSPGPDIARLLEAVREAQAAGEINTRKQALNYIKKGLSRQT